MCIFACNTGLLLYRESILFILLSMCMYTKRLKLVLSIFIVCMFATIGTTFAQTFTASDIQGDLGASYIQDLSDESDIEDTSISEEASSDVEEVLYDEEADVQDMDFALQGGEMHLMSQ